MHNTLYVYVHIYILYIIISHLPPCNPPLNRCLQDFLDMTQALPEEFDRWGPEEAGETGETLAPW